MLGFVIGDNDMITGFRLVGLEGTEVVNVGEAQLALRKAVSRNDLAIVLISEEFSILMRLEIEKIKSQQIVPIIVEIPGRKGSSEEFRMADLVSKTLGVKI
jgi:V/A-type H+/Na+-transporting ATPase subunit F